MQFSKPVSDVRGLTPLVWGHVSPYGAFDLDMEQRLDLRAEGGCVASTFDKRWQTHQMAKTHSFAVTGPGRRPRPR